MKNLEHLRPPAKKTGNNTYTFDVTKESSAREVIAEAIAVAKKENCIVRFDFNGVTVNVNPRSDSDLVYRSWSRMCFGPKARYMAIV